MLLEKIVGNWNTMIKDGCVARGRVIHGWKLFIFLFQVLAADSLNSIERQLFVLFFTHPQLLRRTMTELSARVEAQILATDWGSDLSSKTIVSQFWYQCEAHINCPPAYFFHIDYWIFFTFKSLYSIARCKPVTARIYRYC